VRFNEGGVLKVPWGYVAGLQLDPVEKKPFFHALPGARALSFGMLGCDYHCGYCFTGDTMVATADGPRRLDELHDSCPARKAKDGADLAYPVGLRVVTAAGRLRLARGIVKHRYRGEVIAIKPCYLPALRCTPDHRVYASGSPDEAPRLRPARDVRPGEYLAVPRHAEADGGSTLDVARVLSTHRLTRRVRWDLPAEQREFVAAASEAGRTSAAIGAAIGKSGSYVRHVRRKMRLGRGSSIRTYGVLVEGDRVRFPGEHAPGIPATLSVDQRLGALLGYYCAEGCVVRAVERPNSRVLNFSFAPGEVALAARVVELLRICFGLDARQVKRPTSLGVTVGKASGALLFEGLAGARACRKRVPQAIASAPVPVVQAFLDAYVEGDGHRYPDGKVSATTVSRELAFGIAWLVLRAGHLPSLYANEVGVSREIAGRTVSQQPVQYSVVWYPRDKSGRRLVETEDHYLVPVRSVDSECYDGDVYNMEVEGEHSYLAGFLAVSNCQNWVTSQALRDAHATAPAHEVTPQEIAEIAVRRGARIVTSTYNEPLITSEWGAAVFREAKARGLVCSYVSNGNGTEEVLEYLRPLVSLYKVDLKGFRDRGYRELGGTLERVLWTIGALKARGFWVEVVTLVVPGHNDSPEELRDIARFLVSVSPDIPWHVTAFHPDYRMEDRRATEARSLLLAAETGLAEGLRFVYAGNLPGAVRRFENTYCPSCRALLVERTGYRVTRNAIGADGLCPSCRAAIPGVWA
jgi:pyruvate formate lyase activating enzyme